MFGRVYQSTVGRGVAYGELVTSLPVKLISFSGLINKNNQGILHWVTSSEVSNKSFSIEKSSNASTFVEVDSVLSKAVNGNHEGQLGYDFIDELVNDGTVYYRLKQVDKDGKVSYSKVIKLITNKNVGLVSIYPNPTTANNIKVHIKVADSQKVSIRITDIAGKVVYTNLNISLNAGKNDIIITGKTSLPKGVYTVEVLLNEKKEVIGKSRFVVQ